MLIQHNKSKLTKEIRKEDFTLLEFCKIFTFYTNHKGFTVLSVY